MLVKALCEQHTGSGYICGVASFNPPEDTFKLEVDALHSIAVSLFFPSVPLVKVRRISHFHRVFCSFEPDIILGHSVLPAIYGRIALPALGLRPGFVPVLHSEDDYVDRRFRLIERLLGRRTDAVIAVSTTAAARYRARIRSGVPISVIPNGINLAVVRLAAAGRNQSRARLSLGPNDKLILQVGRLCPLKQQHVSFLATLPFLLADPSMHLWFAGLTEDDNYAKDLRAAIANSRLGTRVMILGSRNDVPALLASADLYLMPSLQEAHSVAMLEALASDVPIVASNITSLQMAAGMQSVNLVRPDEVSFRDAISIGLRQPRAQRDLGNYDISITARLYKDRIRGLDIACGKKRA